MRNLRHIVCAVLCALSAGTFAVEQQDFTRLSERDLVGTARYVGMCGAMTAIGGDPSAVHDNPAGLGLYRRAEVSLTFDYSHDRTREPHEPNIAALKTNRFQVPQASLVIALGNPYQLTGVIYNNFMISYHRTRTYNRRWQALGNSGNMGSLGYQIAQNGVDLGIAYPADRKNIYNDFYLEEHGYINEFSLDWAINISNRWYVGAGLRTQHFRLSDDAEYYEDFAIPLGDSIHPYLQNNSSVIHSGVGCKLAAGIIYRPTRWWRIGLSLETPSIGAFRTQTHGTIKALTDSLRISDAPDLYDGKRVFHSPLRLSASVALQVYDKAMLALQYDYAHTFNSMDFHALRFGAEVVPVNGLYLNAGYAFMWSMNRSNPNPSANGPTTYPMDPTFDRQDTYFRTLEGGQYASVGIGYRGTHMFVQAAYQYHWQSVNLYAHQLQADYMKADTHRLVVTVGWHQN